MRIATRGSDLALWQARWVRDRLHSIHAIHAELTIVTTRGDRDSDQTLPVMEGVGFFTKEIEQALLDGRADLAVHSFKDLPTADTPGLAVAAIPPRAAPNDWLLIRRSHEDAGAPTWPIRAGARVGTCSVRRSAQLLHRRPDLIIADLRGNVPTRVERLRREAFDAIVLAQAGLERLELDLAEFGVVDLLPSGFLPAAGQGALAIQCRAEDDATRSLVQALNHVQTFSAVAAERALSARFQGGCSLALGCLATASSAGVKLQAAWPRSPGECRTCAVEAASPAAAAAEAYARLMEP